MYVIKRTKWEYDPNGDHTPLSISYYKYDGWEEFETPPIDLTGCVLFTERERRVNKLGPSEEFQWYGSYKR